MKTKYLNNTKTILVGKVVGAHGIKGAVKVLFFSEPLLVYTSFNRFLVKIPGNSNLISMEVIWGKPYKRLVRIGFKNVKDRTKADSIIGSKIYVDKSELPMLEDDVYFHSDLIGMSVQSVGGNIIGHLDCIISTGSNSNDVYVVKLNRTDMKESEILIPAIKSVILDIDLVSNLMLVDLPDGIMGD